MPERPVLGDSQISEIELIGGIGVIVARTGAFVARVRAGTTAPVEELTGAFSGARMRLVAHGEQLGDEQPGLEAAEIIAAGAAVASWRTRSPRSVPSWPRSDRGAVAATRAVVDAPAGTPTPRRSARPASALRRSSTSPPESRAPSSTGLGCRNRRASSRSTRTRGPRSSRSPTSESSATCTGCFRDSPRHCVRGSPARRDELATYAPVVCSIGVMSRRNTALALLLGLFALALGASPALARGSSGPAITARAGIADSATLAQCNTGANPADRTARFSATMQSLPRTRSMAISFDLYERSAGGHVHAGARSGLRLMAGVEPSRHELHGKRGRARPARAGFVPRGRPLPLVQRPPQGDPDRPADHAVVRGEGGPDAAPRPRRRLDHARARLAARDH